jgi:hypothetical protein
LSDDQGLGRKEPNVLMIGVDYHPSIQQIAFPESKTGECGEQPLNTGKEKQNGFIGTCIREE